MATFSDIKECRLLANDPPGFIDFIQVADAGHLPGTPRNQTAYNQLDTGEYKIKVGTIWKAIDLRISDSRVGAFIDSIGTTKAVSRIISAIIQKLGDEMRIAQTSDGAEGTTYVSLTQLYNFYKSLQADWLEDHADDVNLSTGKWVRSRTPNIAGGNL